MTSHTNSLQCIFIWHSPDTYIYFPMSLWWMAHRGSTGPETKVLSKLGSVGHILNWANHISNPTWASLKRPMASHWEPFFPLRTAARPTVAGSSLNGSDWSSCICWEGESWKVFQENLHTLDLERLLELCHKLCLSSFSSGWRERLLQRLCGLSGGASGWFVGLAPVFSALGGSYNTSEYNHLTKNHRFQSAATTGGSSPAQQPTCPPTCHVWRVAFYQP